MNSNSTEHMVENRKFGLTVGTAFVLLAGVLIWRQHATAALVAASLGGILILGGLVIPVWLGPVQRAWMAMALAISKVTTPLLMGIVYYLAVTPIGLIMRTIGKNPLRRQWDNGSLWVDRRAAGDLKSDLERQF